MQAPGFKQKPSCHLLFEASMSTEQLCCDRAAGLEGVLARRAQGCDPSHSQDHAGPPRAAPQPPRALLTSSQPPTHSCCSPQFSVTSRCALQLPSRLLIQAPNATGLCLLLRDSTTTDHPLHSVPRTTLSVTSASVFHPPF